jgi:hypothetical protein
VWETIGVFRTIEGLEFDVLVRLRYQLFKRRPFKGRDGFFAPLRKAAGRKIRKQGSSPLSRWLIYVLGFV